MDIRRIIQSLEKEAALPKGNEERFNGYGVMGLPFATGHVLALRKFFRSSIGPAYTSVWHRDPEDEWTFYTDREPEVTCPRFFGRRIKETVVSPIRIDWTGPDRFTVTIESHDFEWEVTAAATPATSLMNGVGSLIPAAGWKSPPILDMMGHAARWFLGTGKVKLHGRVPNGQYFKTNPLKIWMVKDSRARIRDMDMGRPGPLDPQSELGDFRIPQQGILAIGRAFFEPLDATVHYAGTTSDK